MSARLEVDGLDVTGECGRFEFAMPRLVYEEDNGISPVRFAGPVGFQLTLVDASASLRELVDGGSAVHTAKITQDGYSITYPVQFHREWSCVDGTHKVFASMACEASSEAEWIAEPNAAIGRH